VIRTPLSGAIALLNRWLFLEHGLVGLAERWAGFETAPNTRRLIVFADFRNRAFALALQLLIEVKRLDTHAPPVASEVRAQPPFVDGDAALSTVACITTDRHGQVLILAVPVLPQPLD
jgi:hypothetical protein